jgi:hypothetical protein
MHLDELSKQILRITACLVKRYKNRENLCATLESRQIVFLMSKVLTLLCDCCILLDEIYKQTLDKDGLGLVEISGL